jgi:cell division protease FtsH
MSDALGPLSYAKGEEHVFLGREIVQHRDYSDATAQKIDAEVHLLIKNAYERARKVLLDNLDILHKLSGELLEKETIMGKELDELILSLRPGIQLPSKKIEEDEQPPHSPGPTERNSCNGHRKAYRLAWGRHVLNWGAEPASWGF